jgi:glycosyltransferase involved in cell wall biosynthesis
MNILIAHFKALEPRTNSGDLRLFELMKLLVTNGHHVVFVPGAPQSVESIDAVSAIGVSPIGDISTFARNPRRFAIFLLRQNFDCAILCPYYTYEWLNAVIRKTLPCCALVLDTIDLVHVREQRQAALSGDPIELAKAQQTWRDEWSCMRSADAVWVVTEPEKDLLAPSIRIVSVIPNIHRAVATFKPYGQREGIVFLGGYSHLPNVDAVRYFVQAILPEVRKALPLVPIIIAGSNPPPEFMELARTHNLMVTGYVDDHRELLSSCRVGIAPLRYGAGMKGKIGEYLACGLPTVTSSIGAEGMTLRPDLDALVADDPGAFAQGVVKAYSEEVVWNRLATAGPQYIERYLSPGTLNPRLVNALQSAVVENRRKIEQGLLVRRSRLRVATDLVGGKLLEILCRKKTATGA